MHKIFTHNIITNTHTHSLSLSLSFDFANYSQMEWYETTTLGLTRSKRLATFSLANSLMIIIGPSRLPRSNKVLPLMAMPRRRWKNSRPCLIQKKKNEKTLVLINQWALFFFFLVYLPFCYLLHCLIINNFLHTMLTLPNLLSFFVLFLTSFAVYLLLLRCAFCVCIRLSAERSWWKRGKMKSCAF